MITRLKLWAEGFALVRKLKVHVSTMDPSQAAAVQVQFVLQRKRFEHLYGCDYLTSLASLASGELDEVREYFLVRAKEVEAVQRFMGNDIGFDAQHPLMAANSLVAAHLLAAAFCFSESLPSLRMPLMRCIQRLVRTGGPYLAQGFENAHGLNAAFEPMRKHGRQPRGDDPYAFDFVEEVTAIESRHPFSRPPEWLAQWVKEHV